MIPLPEIGRPKRATRPGTATSKAPGPVRFLPELNIFVRRDGSWPNGWQHWTILSPGPWLRASFTVKSGEELTGRALATVANFTPRFAPRLSLS